jgi:aldose 1-epimerase
VAVDRVTVSPFEPTPEGDEVEAITLESAAGQSVTLLTLGATLHRVRLADGADVLLGMDGTAAYLASTCYPGVTVGRYANRIGGAAFNLDGQRHALSANEGANLLHGGRDGFHRRIWQTLTAGRSDAGGVEAALALYSPDGDQGFPGALHVTARFAVRDHRITLSYEARTSAPTPISLTSHGYFNLAGAGAGTLADHWLTVFADCILAVGPDSLPTGQLAPVGDTPFDFRTARPVLARIDEPHPQLQVGRGYDHCFRLADGAGDPALAAVLEHRPSGRRLQVSTTEPGLQLYTGNHLDGRPHGRRSGLCLETQALPDSPNQPDFPSAILRPGQVWRSTTVLDFRPAGE